MKTITVSELQHDVPHYLSLAAGEDIVILNNGTPVGVLRGFADDDDRADYELERDPRFLARVQRARSAFRSGQSIRLEDVTQELLDTPEK